MYFISYQRYHVRPAQFNPIAAPEQTSGNSFVGVRCLSAKPYMLRFRQCEDNDNILLDAIEGT